jgi:plastocyanin
MARAIRRYAVVAAAAMVAFAAGCGGDPDTAPTPPVGTPAPPATPPGEPPSPPAADEDGDSEDAVTVTVGLADFSIDLSEETFTPGTYTFVVEQQGAMAHALAIEGPGVAEETGIINPGGPAEELTVTLEPGTYELWCPVANHRQMGMALTIEVTDSA